jgi:hypothetical protein
MGVKMKVLNDGTRVEYEKNDVSVVHSGSGKNRKKLLIIPMAMSGTELMEWKEKYLIKSVSVELIGK